MDLIHRRIFWLFMFFIIVFVENFTNGIIEYSPGVNNLESKYSTLASIIEGDTVLYKNIKYTMQVFDDFDKMMKNCPPTPEPSFFSQVASEIAFAIFDFGSTSSPESDEFAREKFCIQHEINKKEDNVALLFVILVEKFLALSSSIELVQHLREVPRRFEPAVLVAEKLRKFGTIIPHDNIITAINEKLIEYKHVTEDDKTRLENGGATLARSFPPLLEKLQWPHKKDRLKETPFVISKQTFLGSHVSFLMLLYESGEADAKEFEAPKARCAYEEFMRNQAYNNVALRQVSDMLRKIERAKVKEMLKPLIEKKTLTKQEVDDRILNKRDQSLSIGVKDVPVSFQFVFKME